MTSARISGYVPALRFRVLTQMYDAVVRLTCREGRFKRSLIKQAAIKAEHRVLDLACGTGTLCIWMKQRHPDTEVIGVDGDPAVLAIAARKAISARTNVTFEQGFSYNLPYPDAHFDRVVTSLFFHHLSWEDKQRTALEVLRVLRADGEVHVADWGRPSSTLMRLLHFPVQCLDGLANTQDNVDAKLMPMFQDTGFHNVREHGQFDTVLGTLRLFSAARSSQG